MMEEKNTMLNESVMRLRDECRDLETRRSNAETELRRAQMDLADAQKRVSVAEANLEVSQKVSHDQVCSLSMVFRLV